MNQIEFTQSIPVKGSYDVIVAGGGVAGVAAAVSVARHGRKVLLLEKTNLLGGLATIGLVNWFVPLCNGRGKQIIFGMAEEMLKLSTRHSFNTIPPEWRNGEPEEPTLARYTNRFSANIFALELTDWVLREGVNLLFDCVAAQPVMEGKHCKGIITESKSGREFYEAGIVIDTTGDADILYRAGVPTVQGKNYFTYYSFQTNYENMQKALNEQEIRLYYSWFTSGCANLYGKNHPEGMPYFTGTTVEDVTKYLTLSQTKLLAKIEPEQVGKMEIVTLPTMPQFRTTRRIDGDYTLQVEDVYKHFEDSVGAICDFDHRDFLYEVPYRTMTRRTWDNLICAGRVTAGEGYAWDVLRVIPPAILTGEVTGIAADLALETGKPIAEVEMKELQKRIAASGIHVHFDDALIPQNNAGDAGTKVDSDHI